MRSRQAAAREAARSRSSAGSVRSTRGEVILCRPSPCPLTSGERERGLAARTAAGAAPAAAAATRAPRCAPAATPRGHALALLLRVAAPLLARRLDLGEVEVVLGPVHLDLLGDELLDGLERERARLVHQADRLARRAGPRGAPDAVHIVLRILRKIPVHHVAHALDVQASRGHVGGDQDRELRVLEGVQDLEALLLVHVPGERARLPAVAPEAVLEPPRLLPGVGEDQDAAAS